MSASLTLIGFSVDTVLVIDVQYGCLTFFFYLKLLSIYLHVILSNLITINGESHIIHSFIKI